MYVCVLRASLLIKTFIRFLSVFEFRRKKTRDEEKRKVTNTAVVIRYIIIADDSRLWFVESRARVYSR